MAGELGNDPVKLIRRVAAGDREAFGRLYDRYAPLVFAFALRVLGRRPEAEDLLQEVFLQAWRQAAAYRQERGTPEAWLSTITRSRAIDRLRSIRRREKSFVPIQDPSGVDLPGRVEASGSESDARLTLHGVLTELTTAQRIVLEMAYFEGLTQAEIATRLGEPLGTVKTRIRSGLERLRGLLGVKAGEGAS
jgi:RNA polymerase sigma-70 factor (ECF subfamily)